MSPADLKAARLRLDLTQADMAEKIGRSLRQYRDYELGRYSIPLVVIRAVEGLPRAPTITTTQEDAT